jgi:hypothetical protein
MREFEMIAATVSAMPVGAMHGRISIEGANVYLDGNAGVISMLEVPTHETGISKDFLHFHLSSVEAVPNNIQSTLMNILSRAVVPKLMPIPLRSFESLRSMEKARIEQECACAALPEGWMFDGARYINYEGARASVRPDLNVLLEKWIGVENRKIRSWFVA